MKKSTKIINIFCIIAIFISLACQFVPVWNYSGVITNEKTGEKHAENLKMSIASYIWFPFTQEADAFVDYIEDPTLNYDESLMVLEFTENELSLLKEESSVVQKKFKELSISNEKEENLEESTEATEDSNVTEISEKSTEEKEATVAEEPKDKTEVPVLKEQKDEKEVYTYVNTFVAIREYHKDINDESNKTVLSSIKDNDKTIDRYMEFASEVKSNYVKFINGFIVIPIFLLIAAVFGIFIIIFKMIKGKKTYAASISTFLIGVFNIVHLFIRPIFLLCQHKEFITMLIMFSITTLVGLITLIIDILTYMKCKAKSK